MPFSYKTVAELVDVAGDCLAAAANEEPALLYRAWQTIAELPPAVRKSLLPGFPTHQQFDKLMRAGAHESAAIRLLGSKLGYIASRSPDGTHLISINLPGLDELVFEAESLALGLSAGLLTGLQTLFERTAATEMPTASQLN